ncbi:DUF2306 domain-containing protein [Cellulophaga baltica]|uniref:DUF2306 domain-containing protein n=1 Tax=Cellulophaga TaxID=104264 RepID=UPI001C06FA78|nr:MULTISPECIES: DUF2306 domain-containing protein [Cellulophaga]MBU2996955.1 DUF2306 domain-containing protein [Cellulophaga baltica]MDO6768353.1 DUF2306 domain-containing protein [Cellulophaga sp. 1_MG-2023]
MTTYKVLMFLHLFTVAPCIFIGAYLLLNKKGTKNHRIIGKIYLSLMFFTAMVSLLIPAKVGSQLLNHFGWIHLFSLLTLYSVPTAIIAVKKGDIKAHKIKMRMLYFGALIIAGGFTLAPGRYLHNLFFE